MTDLAETRGPDATEYGVMVVTGDSARYLAEGVISLAPSLGARRIVVGRNPVAKAKVVADVRDCLGIAASRGPVESCVPGDYGCRTIAPMLGRFDRCLESRSYTVESPRAAVPAHGRHIE